MSASERGVKRKHLVLNLFLVIVALGGLAFFFSLDLFSGEGGGLFGEKMSSKLHFRGTVKSTDFNNEQLEKISGVIAKYEDALERIDIIVSKDDSYAELKPGTQVLFEVHVQLLNGTRLEAPLRRTTWGKLVSQVTRKIEKDITAYADMHGGRLKTKGGNIIINSM